MHHVNVCVPEAFSGDINAHVIDDSTLSSITLHWTVIDSYFSPECKLTKKSKTKREMANTKGLWRKRSIQFSGRGDSRNVGWLWGCMLVTPGFRKWRQEDREFQATLDYQRCCITKLGSWGAGSKPRVCLENEPRKCSREKHWGSTVQGTCCPWKEENRYLSIVAYTWNPSTLEAETEHPTNSSPSRDSRWKRRKKKMGFGLEGWLSGGEQWLLLQRT